ncbi:MAG: tyrosine-type recombinase/integrase [Thermodesulfobacteriota bacterium]|nr:tyrosine-type recombinase/integrase [Thermodesulfobacteriota bacterium]
MSAPISVRDSGIGLFKKDIFQHDLRHSFNTHMRKAGVPESVIMKMTGLSTPQMFDRYNTVDMEDARQAASQLRGYFENVHQVLTKNQKT